LTRYSSSERSFKKSIGVLRKNMGHV